MNAMAMVHRTAARPKNCHIREGGGRAMLGPAAGVGEEEDDTDERRGEVRQVRRDA